MAATSANLARHVRDRLKTAKKRSPRLSLLEELFEVVYFTSLKTEEGSYIRAEMTWLDPTNPDPEPPPRIRADRWRYFPFATPIPFTVSQYAKLAVSNDPRSATFVVYPDGQGQLFIWGIVDQALGHEKALRYDADGSYQRPGLFQVRVIGIGHLAAWRSSEFIGELRGESVVTTTHDVFNTGLFARSVNKFAKLFYDYALEYYGDAGELPFTFSPVKLARSFVRDRYASTLQRLVLRIREYGHGGAIVLVEQRQARTLRSKYKITYDGLSRALAGFALFDLDQSVASNILFDHLDKDPNINDIPAWMHFDDVVLRDEAEDHREALDSALWCASLFSRADGAVVLNKDLTVLGYGTEITSKKEPKRLFMCDDINGKSLTLCPLDRFGTRHRSMFRHCWAHPGDLGIVVSQDGDVRAVLRSGQRILVWENVRLLSDRPLV